MFDEPQPIAELSAVAPIELFVHQAIVALLLNVQFPIPRQIDQFVSIPQIGTQFTLNARFALSVVPIKLLTGFVHAFPVRFHQLLDDHAGKLTELPLDIDNVFQANDNVCAGVLICTVFPCGVTCVTHAPTIVLNSRFTHILLLNIQAHHPILDAVFISHALHDGNGAYCTSPFAHITSTCVGAPLSGMFAILRLPFTSNVACGVNVITHALLPVTMKAPWFILVVLCIYTR